ncbi:MAG: MFS transporter [Rhodococcus sp. (in: high G+C Gram-positive bacteria)]|nr:MAG: MFS transporter [Rhodococcus sp. (in: high G+C Gram-positive bacteria)]
MKTALYGNGGHLCDGYILGAIVPALPLFAESHPISPLISGLIGASALIGVFLGSLMFGWFTDKIGRRRMFVIDLALFVVLSLAQIAVTDAVMLLALRVLLGIAVGADYTIATTLVAEFAPRKQRATLLAMGPAMWTVGYVLAIVVGTAIAGVGGDNAWRWILATSAVPALVLLVLRRKTPESPRWLAQNGRTDEALAILRKHVSPTATLADLAEEEEPTTGSLGEVFAKHHRKRLVFCCLFWFCQVVPYFAVFTFLPTILDSLHIESGFWQTTSVNLFLLIGGVVGMVTISKIGRRPYTLISFALLAASTLAIGLWQDAPAGYVIALFALFALVSSAMSALDTVYPSELFPTSIRATATGICVSFSRIGAAIGTLLLPVGIDRFGAHGVTLLTAAIAGVGFLISYVWAPETARLTLAQAAGETDTHPAGPAAGSRNDNSPFVSQP